MKRFLIPRILVMSVTTLFVSCPHKPIYPLQPEDTITKDTIIPPEDSLYNYVSEEYLRNYMPFNVGTKFIYLCEKDSITDTLELTLDQNLLWREYWFKEIDFKFEYDIEETYIIYHLNNSEKNIISFVYDIYTSVKKDNPYARVMSSYEFNSLTTQDCISIEDYCECNNKECLKEGCIIDRIEVHKDGNLYAILEQGTGIIQFLDNEGNIWKLK